MKRKRIVSLVASSTEIICALGFEDCLVGRSHESDYPLSVQSLPVCSSPKFEIEGSSREVDDWVRFVLENALSVYKVDVETVRDLKPDLIVTQDHCKVCAVSMADLRNAAFQSIPSQPEIFSLAPDTLSEIYNDIQGIALALDDTPAGEKLVTNMREAMAEVHQETSQLHSKPRVAFVEWIDPVWTSGHWTQELIEMAGGADAWDNIGSSKKADFETLRNIDADVIIVSPCGYGIAKAIEELPALTAHPSWSGLKAVKNNRVYIADGNQYFNRPGPRLVDSLEILAEILHPEVFPSSNRGAGWIPLED